MPPRHLTKWHLMCYLMNCVIVPCVHVLPSYYIICAQINLCDLNCNYIKRFQGGLAEDQATYLEASLQSPQCNCTLVKLSH